MSAIRAQVTQAVASGVTTGLALDETALIALVTPGTVTKASGTSTGSVELDLLRRFHRVRLSRPTAKS